MANKKYTELPQANAITGAEILAMVQDGGSVQGDIDLIKAYFDTLYAPAVVRYTSSAQTITLAGSLTLAHGLGAAPFWVGAYLECVTGEYNYVAGDKLYIGFAETGVESLNNLGVSVVVNDTTNIRIRFSAGGFAIPNKTTGATALITPANWSLRIIAEK